MRIYLSVDLEGVNGVLHSSQTQPGEPGYERSVGLMHEETRAVMTGLEQGGATNFLVNDSHWDMRNLRTELLSPHKATLINGGPKPYSMVSGTHDSANQIEAAGFVGYHAKAGDARGVLSHTYRALVFFDVQLNGKQVGETGLNANLAGHFGVPVILVSGDDVLCAEAKELMPWVHCLEVKRAVSRYSAACPPFHETLKLLQEGSKKALEDKSAWQVLKPPSPSTMTITMFDPAMADAAELLPYVKRKSGRQIEFSHDDYAVLFNTMLAVGALGSTRKDPYF